MESIKLFLSRSSGSGSGSGDGYGDGDGSGSGSGYGDGSGYGSGFGYGSGSGSGSGSGDGYGDGSGYGDGDGYGSGSGSGYGDGSGSGVLSYNNFKVYMIDYVPTIIYSVKGSIARGAILRNDMTLKDCYIVKVGNYFAHGATARKAYADAQAKAMQGMSVEERIDKFCAAHPDFGKKYPYADLFSWHNILTGSCELGRREWCKERGIIEDDSFTVEEFCELTQNAYGGKVIKQLYIKYKRNRLKIK